MERLICLAIGYVFGLFQTGYIYGKLHNIDIRQHGSGNAGATNVVRTLGRKAGITVFFGDAFKTIFACAAARIIFAGHVDVDLFALWGGLGAILGHNFPFYLKFKGGKGTASFVGLTLAINWKLALAVLVILVLATVITDYIVVGTFSVIVTVPAYMGLFAHNLVLMAIICIASFAIFFKHWENIGRLIRKEEIGLRSTIRGDKRYDKQ